MTRSTIVLEVKHAPALRCDLAGVLPSTLAGMQTAEIERIPLGHGNGTIALADCFRVSRSGDEGGPPSLPPSLRLVGDCARFDRIGADLDSGTVVVDGDAGDFVGAAMRAGEILVQGRAGHLAACEMKGGTLRVTGDVGDYCGGALPGDLNGMAGGMVLIEGRAGDRLCDRMRRGTVIVQGDTGAFPASRMVAGTLAIGGQPGPHLGYAMRRGTVMLAAGEDGRDHIGSTFVPVTGDVSVAWQLMGRHLATHGGPRFHSLPGRRFQRYVGDCAVQGKGEIFVPA